MITGNAAPIDEGMARALAYAGYSWNCNVDNQASHGHHSTLVYAFAGQRRNSNFSQIGMSSNLRRTR